MAKSLDKHLPYLKEFLRYAQNDPIIARRDQIIGGSAIAIVFATPFVAIPIGLATNSWGFGILAAFATIGAGIFIGNRIYRKAAQPANDLEAALSRAVIASKPFQSLRGKGKLHKSIDVGVLQLLEAAAYHWSRIQNQVRGPLWNRADLPAHWLNVRDQSRAAADRAMVELLQLSVPAIGQPENKRERDIQDIIEDLAEGDIADAVRGMKQYAKKDWTDYAHRSPVASNVLQSGLSVAERLQKLAEQLEQVSGTLTVDAAMSQTNAQSVHSIDAVLSEIGALRQAEDEIRLQQRVGDPNNP